MASIVRFLRGTGGGARRLDPRGEPRPLTTPSAHTSARFLLATTIALGLAGLLFFLIVKV